MTLIVGVLCSDGVVLGADGAATFGALGQRTVRQPTRKLTISDDGAVVIGTSGSVGLAQRVISEIEKLWKTGALGATPPPRPLINPQEAMMVRVQAHAMNQSLPAILQPPVVVTEPVHAGPVITTAIRPHLLGELVAAQQASGALGQGVAVQGAVCLTLVAFPIGDRACMLSFDQQGAPEVASDDLPFVTLGSGQAIADPFMSFLRRVLWTGRKPTINEGLFAAIWTLQHAIETNPGGVADPKQVVTLKRDATAACGWRARELPEGDWQEHLQAVKAAETGVRSFVSTLAGVEDSKAARAEPSIIEVPPKPEQAS